jgi:hypothetical protein
MKCIFLFFCVISLALHSSVTYAQQDTLIFSIKNLPTVEHTDDYTAAFNQHDSATTYAPFSDSHIYIFDTIVKNNDTTFFFNRNDARLKLTVVFDKSTFYFKIISFSFSDYTPGYKDYYGLSLSNVFAYQNGNVFIADVKGDSIISSELIFNRNHFNQISFQNSYTDDLSATGKFTDSTVISFSLSKQKLLGVKPSEKVAYSQNIFPNPASNLVHFSIYDVSPLEANVFNVLGMNVLSNKLPQPMNEIVLDISSLPPGIYYLRAGNQMQKFVIKR